MGRAGVDREREPGRFRRRPGRGGRLLEQLGVGADRLRIEWISSSEGERFAEVVAAFTETIARAGPLAPPKAQAVTA